MLFNGIPVAFEPPVLHEELIQVGKQLHASQLLGELHLVLVIKSHIGLHVLA